MDFQCVLVTWIYMAQVTDGCVELVIYFQCPQIQKVKVLFKFRIFSFHGWDWNLSYFNHSKGFKLKDGQFKSKVSFHVQ